MEDFSWRSLLLTSQNPDGGWGYFPGRQSWLEPTAWAALALHGHESAERAYKLIRRWQYADGSTRPCAHVDSPHWTAALLVKLAVLRRDLPVVRRGVKYLMETIGSESGPLMRVLHYLDPQGNDREPKFEGWPWRAGAAAWVEPTVHSISALRLASPLINDPRIKGRILSGQNLIWHQRCRGGGWNYGARVAREVSLLAYPETTAVALIGLVGRKGLHEEIEFARTVGASDGSPLSRAWLSVGLRLHGQEPPDVEPAPMKDVMVYALSELGSPGGHWRILGEQKS